MTNFKAIIIADAHIGADKFDTHPDRWDAPVREAFQFAVDNDADIVISAGDFFHKRNPTVSENIRCERLFNILRKTGIQFIQVDGNHDRPNAEGAHSALEIEKYGTTFQGQLAITAHQNVNIIAIPWPRPTDYLTADEMKMGIDDKIALTRERIYEQLTEAMRADKLRPTILFGHFMLAYGAGIKEAQDPGLILGKDVMLEWNQLIESGLTENQIFAGHVHDPASLGYVGSTQPTDWGDWQDDKSFVELVIGEVGHGINDLTKDGFTVVTGPRSNWSYATRRHSYANQLQLHDIVIDNVAVGVEYDEMIRQQLVTTPIDVVRITVNLVDDGRADEAVIRQIFESRPNYARVDRVIINHAKREAVRVETETPLADMPEDEAFETWLKQSGFTDEQAAGPCGIFQSLVEASK